MNSNLLPDYLDPGQTSNLGELYKYVRPEIESRIFLSGDSASGIRHSRQSICATAKNIARKLYLNAHAAQFKTVGKGDVVLSSAYFNLDLELQNIGREVYKAPWVFNRGSKTPGLFDSALLRWIAECNGFLSQRPFHKLADQESLSRVQGFKDELAAIYRRLEVSTFICASPYPLFDRMSVDAIADAGGKAYMFMHGIPGVYERHMKFFDGSFDLLLWGNAFKDKYGSLGVSTESMHVTGHPFYKTLECEKLIIRGDSPLVITKAPSGIRVDKEDKLGDQSSTLLYLFSVQRALEAAGIKKALVRPHPSENIEWYRNFLNPDFYTVAGGDLSTALKSASVIVGPTSTTMLDANYYGTPYVVYEPLLQEKTDLFGNPLVMPFDGSDPRVPVAHSECQLSEMLSARQLVDLSYWHDYVQTPFDISMFSR
jgi:hypothetical protein